MEIRSLSGVSPEVIYEAFSAAFADYEMQLTADGLYAMLRRRGFDPALSFAAFEDGENIAAFTLNGTGEFDGLPTAYDTGTGTLPGHRGQGLASDIFRHSVPLLREAGIRRYLLEVLQHNTAAVSVYRKLGFRVTREFDYFSQEYALVALPDAGKDYKIIPLSADRLAGLSGFTDFRPSWQNSLGSIRRAGEQLIIFGAESDGRIAGYCVFEPSSGDITQIAVDPGHRRRGIGTRLLAQAIKYNRCGRIKVVNTETTCASIRGFLAAVNIPLQGRQFEMVLEL